MKKAYAKPRLYAESFELLEHISAGCGVIAQFGTDCGIVDGLVTFFAADPPCNEDGISAVEFKFGDGASSATLDDFINQLQPQCYNSFADYNLLINS